MIIFNKDINTYESIYNTILLIKEEFKTKQVISIIFENNVKFIEPLFFILLLNLHDKYKDSRILVIDILDLDYSKQSIEYFEKINKIQEKKNLKHNRNVFLDDDKVDEQKDFQYPKKDNRQHFVQRILLEYLETGYIVKRNISNNRKNYYINDYENKNYKDKKQREYNYERTKVRDINKYLIVDDNTQEVVYKNIYLYYSKEHKDTLFQKADENRRLIPILKLKNMSNALFNNSLHYNDVYTEKDNRKELFEGLLKNINNNFERTQFDSFIEKIFDTVRPNSYKENLPTLVPPLKNLIYECIDNVKTHTNEKTNSYFNFYYDSFTKEFKIVVYDDFEGGFLNNYKKNLEQEFASLTTRFKNENIDKEIKEHFQDTILKLDKVNKYNDFKVDHIILKKIFDTKGTFEAHQIPRIVMHFGIPTLVKIINDIGGYFNIRLHRKITENESIYYYFNSSKKEIETSKKGLDGTQIYISIPHTAKYKIRKAQPLNFKKDDLIQISQKKDFIENKIKKFTSINDKNSKSQQRIFDYNIYFNTYPDKTISDFLRDLYYISHVKGVYDALVINFPVEKYESYLQNLVHILFYNHKYIEDVIIPLNVVFFNKTSFDLVFIGGKSYSEFYNSNKLISEHYGKYNNQITDILIDSSKIEKNIFAESEFFCEINDDLVVLPFELYDKSEISIQHIIMNNLNENKLNLHIDVGKNIHISEFYKFDIIFQNSRFIDRIVHKLLENLYSVIDDFKNKEAKFIGIGKYSNLLLATIYKNLGKDINEYYLVLENLIEISDLNNLNEYIENNNDSEVFCIVTPVSFDGKQVKKEIIDKYKNKEIYWMNVIQITLEGEKKNKITEQYNLLEVQLKKDKYWKIEKENKCKICNSENELPLFKINNKNNFTIDNCYLNKYKKKKFSHYLDINKVKWADSISFGHVVRGNNHYLYYTKTIQFFNKNFKEIVNFLKSVRITINKEFIIPNYDIKIITPMHSTHNKFLTFVNSVVFDGKANILQIDLGKDSNSYLEQNIEEDTLFFYVDDEISSGTTMNHIYSFLKSYEQISGFDGAIILIDRMSQQDEIQIEQLINFKNKKPKEFIHLFTKLEIKPIKTTKYEECFLCKRKDGYKKLLKDTVLDINRFQIAKKISKLNIVNHSLIDFDDGIKQNNNKNELDLNRKIRDYIKMISVDYIYERFDTFSNLVVDNYDKVFENYCEEEYNFTEYILNSLKKLFKVEDKHLELFNKICNYEASIALIKALSFPKLVYFKDIRHLATVVIIKKINIYILKKPLDNIFNIELIKSISNEQETKNKKAFILEYQNKVNINYLNFLYITAGYLNIQNILSLKNLNYYFETSLQIKKEKFTHEFLQPYQLAVKMVSMSSSDKSMYLDHQVNLFFDNKKNAKDIECTDYTLIEALIVENNSSIDKKVFGKNFNELLSDLLKESKKNIVEKINLTKSYIEELIKKNSVYKQSDIKVESIYINENIHTKYNNYESALDNIEFIDILNDFNKFNNEIQLKYVNRITKGALSVNSKECMNITRDIKTEEIHYIDNTWSNIFIDNFFLNNDNEKCLLIRLVDIDIDKLDETIYPKSIKNFWYKPVGCLALSCNDNKKELLALAKIVLSIQSDLVKFLKEEFSHETFREILKRKDEEKRNEDIANDYARQISAINHSFKDQIDLRSRIDSYLNGKTNTNLDRDNYLKSLSSFSYGLHHLSSLTSVNPNKIKEGLTSIDITQSLNTYIQDGFFYGMKKFISIVHYFIDNINKNFSSDSIDISNLKSNTFKLKLDQVTHMNHICFEFIFNAIKNYNLNETSPIIKIYSLENNIGIVFENKVKEDFSLDGMKKKLTMKSRIGLKFIEEILNEQEYLINFELNEGTLKILIKRNINYEK